VEEETMLLEEGMVIYNQRSVHNVLERYVITRVTRTQAIIDHGKYETRFDRDIKDRTWFYAKGDSSGYSRSSYCIATPELDEKYYRQRLVYTIGKVDMTTLSTEKLKQIYAIVKEEETV
jgi:hypothetical protein